MKPVQRVTIVANTVCHGLEIGSTHKVDDTIQWKTGERSVVIGRWYVPYDNVREAEDNMLPKYFSFIAKGGTGIIYRASSEGEGYVIKWEQDGEALETTYGLMAVVDFVTAGQWKIIS